MIIFYAYKMEKNLAYMDAEESRHCLKVLRKRSGGKISFTDGLGKLYEATILSSDRKGIVLHEIATVNEQVPTSRIIVAISPTKMPSRFEWFVEKSVEIGVTDIIPLICHRTEKKNIKSERVHNIIRSASKQSLSYRFPILHELQDFSSTMESFSKVEEKYIASFDEKNLHLMHTATGRDTIVFIGPEGDFTDKELQLALNNGFEKVNISSSRLRTETAGIVTAHILSLVKETK